MARSEYLNQSLITRAGSSIARTHIRPSVRVIGLICIYSCRVASLKRASRALLLVKSRVQPVAPNDRKRAASLCLLAMVWATDDPTLWWFIYNVMCTKWATIKCRLRVSRSWCLYIYQHLSRAACAARLAPKQIYIYSIAAGRHQTITHTRRIYSLFFATVCIAAAFIGNIVY